MGWAIRLYASAKSLNRGVWPFRPYMDRLSAVFVHIPRSAGTAVSTALAGRQVVRDHATWKQFAQADRRRFDRYFKFAFVRNPWDRAVSTFNCLTQMEARGLAPWFPPEMSFEAFLMDYLDEHRLHEHVLFKPQYLFICDHSLEIKVDFLGRYESLELDFASICRRIGMPVRLQRKNSSREERQYSQWYRNEAMVERVAHLYKRDCELFDYRFEG